MRTTLGAGSYGPLTAPITGSEGMNGVGTPTVACATLKVSSRRHNGGHCRRGQRIRAATRSSCETSMRPRRRAIAPVRSRSRSTLLAVGRVVSGEAGEVLLGEPDRANAVLLGRPLGEGVQPPDDPFLGAREVGVHQVGVLAADAGGQEGDEHPVDLRVPPAELVELVAPQAERLGRLDRDLAVAVRSPASIRAISPTASPGPKTAKIAVLPVGVVM